MVKYHLSTLEDFDQWIRLATEVEPLFGPMVKDPRFNEGLRQAILDGNAFCIRKADSGDGKTLQGGIVVSREANEILWFAVEEGSRGQGIGKTLLKEAIQHLDHSRPITVTTFDGSVKAGLPARRLYQKYGFNDSRPDDMNPAGIPTVVMVRSHEESRPAHAPDGMI